MKDVVFVEMGSGTVHHSINLVSTVGTKILPRHGESVKFEKDGPELRVHSVHHDYDRKIIEVRLIK
jgi:hypothetical protein